MENRLDLLRFRFQEELALRNSLYSIAELVLKFALDSSGANSAVFLYAAPGNTIYEKVASIGLGPKDEKDWSHCRRDSDTPLSECIRLQKYLEVKKETGIALMAFPLIDSDIAGAGFSISFSPNKNLDEEAKRFLFWLASLAERAIFNQDGEGV
jgi:hypothetical protein